MGFHVGGGSNGEERKGQLTDVAAALLQRVALVEGGGDVRALVAHAAAGEGARAGLDLALDLGAEGRGRNSEGADEREEGGDDLVCCVSASGLRCTRSYGKGFVVFLTRTILSVGYLGGREGL